MEAWISILLVVVITVDSLWAVLSSILLWSVRHMQATCWPYIVRERDNLATCKLVDLFLIANGSKYGRLNVTIYCLWCNKLFRLYRKNNHSFQYLPSPPQHFPTSRPPLLSLSSRLSLSELPLPLSPAGSLLGLSPSTTRLSGGVEPQGSTRQPVTRSTASRATSD